MKTDNLVRLTLIGGLLLSTPSLARAQFPGDVFFAEPSIAVPEHGTGTFEVLLFSGADPVGATHVEVVFDPARAEIVGVEAGATEELASGHVAVTVPGRASLVGLNGRSLTEPIGTASLALVEIRPLVPAGSRIEIDLQVRSLLDAGSNPLPGQGFSGEILVVSGVPSGAPRTAVAGSAAPAPEELARRAHRFRRPGAAVVLLELVSRGGVVSTVPHRVIAPDPGAPSEAGER